jgi:tetratricopeptide (TPR) repeat protein
MKMAGVILFLILTCWLACAANSPHHPAILKEYDRVFTTYAYSDPDPVPRMSRFYPYFRYDGFTDAPVQQKWKVVELSNDYLQVLILPQIGGKIWAAIDKSTGKSFIYFNHVVKFRDVSMRGPWTSGGMEPNYGIMGHTPNCFTPVDYLARQNPDGSASCFIGVLDLLTRSTWRLEINLPAGEACFSTRSLWHNGSGLDEPYYTWMNVGIKAAGNLQFINPGTKYLGHDGKVSDWPINPDNGRDLSWYEQNNFGSYKSYHVFGRLAEFFGGYWHDEDFGMARCSGYRDKPGRKIWIWGLSREGMIWEKLLTDADGQYVEVQSGRLFNQADENSSLTPFKHKEFAPYATDTWTEYWEPVKGTKGFVSASPWGALNVTREGDRLVLRISPARNLRDKLQVFDGQQLVWEHNVDLKPLQPVTAEVKLIHSIKNLRVSLGVDKLDYSETGQDVLSRPNLAPANFHWNSGYGMYLKGKESARQRAYTRASTAFEECLAKDPDFIPALVEMASLQNRQGHWSEARELAQRALSIDTYDPAANYQFGLANSALKNMADAKDAFSIAALSEGWRSAANIELGKAFLREKRYERGEDCAIECLETDKRNLDALQLRACAQRLQSKTVEAETTVSRLLQLDPLNHFARFEKFLQGKARREDFSGMIRNELPQETFLELAAWYRNVGRDQDAAKVLELAPPTAEVLYWLAYLRQDTNLLSRAASASPAFVFPFRTEAISVFEWAAQVGPGWGAKYFLALIRWSQGDLARARALLTTCRDEPGFAPFYAARAQVSEDTAIADLKKAARIDLTQWRYDVMLARLYLQQNRFPEALSVAADSARRFPTNDVVAVLHAKCLVANDRFADAAALLSSLNLLPCEGSTEAHSLFRESNLMLASERLKAGAYADALKLIGVAQEWPEHLGAGKPYAEDIDERLENWLAYQCQRHLSQAETRRYLENILGFSSRVSQKNVGELVRMLALREAGKEAEAKKQVEAWLEVDPSSNLARWAHSLLNSASGPLPAGLQNIECRILAASLQ